MIPPEILQIVEDVRAGDSESKPQELARLIEFVRLNPSAELNVLIHGLDLEGVDR